MRVITGDLIEVSVSLAVRKEPGSCHVLSLYRHKVKHHLFQVVIDGIVLFVDPLVGLLHKFERFIK